MSFLPGYRAHSYVALQHTDLLLLLLLLFLLSLLLLLLLLLSSLSFSSKAQQLHRRQLLATPAVALSMAETVN